MTQNFHLPPVGFGPGSQSEDDAVEYMSMPQDMRTYSPHIPDEDAAQAPDGLALLAAVADAAKACAETGQNVSFDLSGLASADRALIAEVMGEGEVAITMRGVPSVAAQESVFAGIWRLSGAGVDRIEVGAVPQLALDRAFDPLRAPAQTEITNATGLANAPALLNELLDKSAAFSPDAELHVINLTLLPHTESDLDWLGGALGEGAVAILSRGYGNCRISATATRGIWRVQFFNSTDALILDTFEVTTMPEVAKAAPEDLADSGRRLHSVLEAIQ